MTLRFLAAATALSFGLSAVAQAQPTLNPPTAAAEAAQASPSPKPAEAPQAAAPAKPAGYRTATYAGGAGATWKTGRDAYGFMGSYGGCRYKGHAGPHGYRIDRAC
ncbi:translation initiation factor IF-2 [uncultured Methylobacterium sp.]|uniref:translation initiation factor IF-2 n=1 Tax=uncultured Methylobacterium sp. TaxID=157278 RepID=UPI0035CBE4C1